mmetsp:Transcript_39804/g.95536  ORF Transcript_39804/g.95536 Transcript_39804/m.95536 type:complete len:211 (-) Transcript_39804:501-1133(-)
MLQTLAVQGPSSPHTAQGEHHGGPHSPEHESKPENDVEQSQFGVLTRLLNPDTEDTISPGHASIGADTNHNSDASWKVTHASKIVPEDRGIHLAYDGCLRGDGRVNRILFPPVLSSNDGFPGAFVLSGQFLGLPIGHQYQMVAMVEQMRLIQNEDSSSTRATLNKTGETVLKNLSGHLSVNSSKSIISEQNIGISVQRPGYRNSHLLAAT